MYLIAKAIEIYCFPQTPNNLFKASADASWQHARNEYLYTYNRPDVVGAGWTKSAASALNSDVYTKVHV